MDVGYASTFGIKAGQGMVAVGAVVTEGAVRNSGRRR